MYCNIEKLAEIEKELKGTRLENIFYDANHANIYLQFHSDNDGNKILTIPNNCYAGLEMLPTATMYAAERAGD